MTADGSTAHPFNVCFTMHGIGVSGGIAIGHAHLFSGMSTEVDHYAISAGDKCHVIGDVLVDGVSVGAVTSYTFTDVQANHTIAASFTLLGPYKITASAGPGGSITPNGSTVVPCEIGRASCRERVSMFV